MVGAPAILQSLRTGLSFERDGVTLGITASPDARRLDELRTFRAEVLYADGRRPEFRDPHGRFIDDQEIDSGAYHLTARASVDGPLLAYARIAVPELSDGFQCRELLGPNALRAALEGFGVNGERVVEAGRLVVKQKRQGRQLGKLFISVGLAVVRVHGAEATIGTAGVLDGQARLYQRFGFKVHPGERYYSTHYQDEICVIVHRTADGALEFEDTVAAMAEQIVSTARQLVAS